MVRQCIDEAAAGCTGGHVAAVKQQVAAGLERGADLRKQGLVGGQGALIENGVAKIERTRGAVREDVNRSEILHAAQRGGNLPYAVAA